MGAEQDGISSMVRAPRDVLGYLAYPEPTVIPTLISPGHVHLWPRLFGQTRTLEVACTASFANCSGLSLDATYNFQKGVCNARCNGICALTW